MMLVPLAIVFATETMPQTGGFTGSAPTEAVAPASVAPAPPAPISYADAVDLVLEAPLVIDATIRSTARIKGAEAVGLPAGVARFYIEADVGALIRGPDAIPQRVGYVYDAPLDARGRVPQFRKARVILFARPAAGAGGDQVQLVSRDGQFAWSPGLEMLARRAARDVAAADAPPAVTGVGKAFHVPGALPGEGETQIFLNTTNGRPVSLSVLRRPGEEPRWAVALSEIVDDAAGPPAHDTLLWYRLACALPPTLPDASGTGEEPDNAAKAAEDYAYVLGQLGPCRRLRATAGA
jgi:hypothetical protein